MRKNTVWLVIVAIVLWLWYAMAKKSSTTGASFTPETKARDAKGQLQGIVKNAPSLDPARTVTVSANDVRIAQIQGGAVSDAAVFLDMPLGYLVEVLLSYTQQQCGVAGAPDGQYVPEGTMAQTAVIAMQTIEPTYNMPGGIDGCQAKLAFLGALIKKTGRPKLWGINV